MTSRSVYLLPISNFSYEEIERRVKKIIPNYPDRGPHRMSTILMVFLWTLVKSAALNGNSHGQIGGIMVPSC